VTDQTASLQQEIHSLAAEIVHAYEELHLLYELGEVLTSDLSVSEVTTLILEKIEHALNADHARLTLVSSPASVQSER
jgi:hypothetical protein